MASFELWLMDLCSTVNYALLAEHLYHWSLGLGSFLFPFRLFLKTDLPSTGLMPKPTTNPPPTRKPTKPTSTQVTIKTTPTERPPPTTDCQDTAPRHCQFWSNLGQCKKQSKWMRENCKKSCGVCTCQDIHNTANCKRWAAVGECNKNPTWMEVNCPRSCLVCDCHNKNTKCSQWAKKAFCNDNQYAVWMAKNCKKSCNKC